MMTDEEIDAAAALVRTADISSKASMDMADALAHVCSELRAMRAATLDLKLTLEEMTVVACALDQYRNKGFGGGVPTEILMKIAEACK